MMVEEVAPMAHYKTLDRIDNLKIGIQLFKKIEPDALIEELEVKWQESISEYLKLIRHTPISSHKSKKTKKTTTESVRMLFTITDTELGGLVDEFQQKCNINKMVMERDVIHPESFIGDEYFPALDTSQVGLPPERGKRWDHKMTQSVYSVMKIVAKDPRPGLDGQIYNTPKTPETLLLIQYFGNGNFSVQPDFTKDGEKHELVFGDDTYVYTVENRSEQLSEKHEGKEKLIFEEFFKKLYETRKERLPFPVFDSISPEFLHRLSIFGEIVSTEHFGVDRMYLEYTMHFPEEWKPDPSVSPKMTTCTSQVALSTIQTSTNTEVTYFGLPFEYHFLTKETDPTPCSLYFKIKSVDMWNRQAVIGYGSTKFPTNSTTDEIHVRCWKPVHQSYHTMKTFFLGGCPELQDIKFYEMEVLSPHLGKRSAKSVWFSDRDFGCSNN
jgi:hypothetical protein